MRRVLMVAYYFPPIAASGSLRPLGFCRYLEQYGWKPQVLTTDFQSIFPPLGADHNLAAKVPESVKVEHVAHPNPGQNLIRLRNLLRKKFIKFSKGEMPVTEMPSQQLKVQSVHAKGWGGFIKDYLWDWLFLYPDPQRYWFGVTLRKMAKLRPHEYPDVVWATGSPWTGLLVGMRLAKRFGVPFLADFRDPWHGNPYKRTLAPRLTQKTKELERLICSEAAKVVATTPELSAQFKSVYPDLKEKFSTITNGFDANGDLSSFLGSKTDNPPCPDDKTKIFEFCHFGTIYGARNPFPFLSGIKELIEEKRIRADQVRVKFFGRWDVQDDQESTVQDLEARNILCRIPPISHQECLQKMAQASVLLILQPDSPLQIPGKIYEYVSLGRPILVIGGEGATASMVRRHNLGRYCPNEVGALKEILFNLISERDYITPPTTSVASEFHYRSLTKQLAFVLNSLC